MHDFFNAILLLVERDFIDPVKASSYQQKFAFIQPMKPDLYRIFFECSFDDQGVFLRNPIGKIVFINGIGRLIHYDLLFHCIYLKCKVAGTIVNEFDKCVIRAGYGHFTPSNRICC